MVITRQQRERLVLNVYNQGKNTPEIAEEVRMSFSAIGAILKKAEEEKEARTKAVSSLSGLLFSEGKTPLQVAIALNLRDDQVTELYNEYWNLNHLHDLSQVYEEIKDDIVSFLNLYKLAKAAGMNTQQVIRLLRVSNNHLPAVEQRYESLKRELYSLEGDKRNSL